MNDRASPEVLAALRDALTQQIAESDPPETAATFARLRADGVAEDVVWRLLSAALLQEMACIVRDGRPFDRAGYVAALHRLPELADR